MKRSIIPTAEPFLLPRGKNGCVLIHGFTGSPKEMRLMGEYQQSIASYKLETVSLERSGHVITEDVERDITFKATLKFIQK